MRVVGERDGAKGNDWAMGWQFRAACRGEESALFFAPNYFERREQKNAREVRAKAICARCPVRTECLEYALRIREPHGIWGGLNEFERRTLLRTRGQRLHAG
jgi:WhiB family transcriptional regulator, redox-sensing transcriptional regulator